MIRVTIDATPLLFRSAGVKNYFYYWTRHLLREARGVEIRLFPFLDPPAWLDHERSIAGPAATLARLALLQFINRFPNDLAGWSDPRVNVFHACKLLNPPRRARLTATMHDFTSWTVPEMQRRTNIRADRLFADRILKRADGLIAVSEATRSDAVRLLNLPPDKICVIHHGISREFFEAGPNEAGAARSRHGLQRSYLLFAGTIEPRKNVDLLLDAYQGLSQSIRDEFDLVVVGPRGWAPESTLARLLDPPMGIRYLGYVPEQDLPGLFAGAAAFVYPSLYEGFGFPVAQAMAAGAPVVTSSVSSLPEIAGGAALLVDPRSEAELRGALGEILTSPAKRERLSALGRANASRFSWPECARQSLRFFERVAG